MSGNSARQFIDTNVLVYATVAESPLHDANIVATMLAHDIKHLLTDNVEDFSRYASYITVVPVVE